MTRAYVEARSPGEGIYLASDEDASYEKTVRIDISDLEPQIALPHSPDHVKPVSQVEPLPLDEVFIGSCTNGRMTDLRTAAEVLAGRRVAKGTRLVIIPGSQAVYREALAEGLLATFLDAGAVIGPPCCGPCLGGHMGVLAEGERAVSTTNRNFEGRMGHAKSQVYLSGPAVAAASAVLGRIGSPKEL
jgi:3-isopropylmalate/(R)-2-methylmalate dehydratase large subunit